MVWSFAKSCLGTLSVLLVLCISGPAAAQDDQSRKQCTKLGLLVGIVDITSMILDAEDRRLPDRFEALENLGKSINPSQIETHLDQANHSGSTDDVRAYLDDLNRFIQIRRVNGPAFGGWVLNASTFKARHSRMLALTEELCKTTPLDQIFDMLKTVSDQFSQDSAPEPAKSKSLTPPKKLQATKATSSKWSQPFKIRKEVLMLMQVFFLLASTILSLFTANYLIKLSRAVRLDRYSCAIPARLELDGLEFLGEINVLSKRGASFQVTEPLTQLHHDTLHPDRHVRFLTEVFDVLAVQTIAFDGSAGFRLPVPLSKPKLQALLATSTIKPRRKIEMKQKKKPATPIKVSLARKSQSAPAD